MSMSSVLFPTNGSGISLSFSTDLDEAADKSSLRDANDSPQATNVVFIKKTDERPSGYQDAVTLTPLPRRLRSGYMHERRVGEER